jgi:MFS family permease
VTWTGDLQQLLALRGFRALYASRLTSQAADGVFQASLVSYVLFSPERATSAAVIAASLAVVLLPFSVIGPFAGIVLDRVSRQRVLVVCSLLRAGFMAVLVAIVAAGHTGVDFYAVALAVVSVNRFVLAALSAGLPVVVGVERLVGANALSVTSGTVATLLGAGAGSGIRGLIGGDDAQVAVVAAMAGLAYLGAAATASRPGRTTFGPVEAAPWQGMLAQARAIMNDMLDAARYLWNHGPTRRALTVISTSRISYGLILVMTVLLYQNYFTGGLGGFGGLTLLVSASGVGTIAAAFATPRVTRRLPKPTWITIVLIGAGVVAVALGLPFDSTAFIGAGALLGFSAQASKICVDTIVQEQTADAYRGRAFALYDLLFNISFVAAAAVAALLVPPSGRSGTMILIAGAGYLLAGLLYYKAASRHPGEMVVGVTVSTTADRAAGEAHGGGGFPHGSPRPHEAGVPADR